ncbi:hypothetical protein PTKIN_Ptkin14bG0220500 [Pterospermum kingtungense]
MAESLISIVLEQLTSITVEQAAQAFKLVTGAEEEAENLTSNLRAIQEVLKDAEERQMKEETVKHWLNRLRDVSYDIDDVLDEWNTAILKRQIEKEESTVTDHVPPPKKVWSFALSSCFCARQVVLKHDIAVKIQQLNKRLGDIANERSRYDFRTGGSSHEQIRNITTSVIDKSVVFGREDDRKAIKDMLLCGSSEETLNLRIISVVGMGGMGKTTLSQLAYNDVEVKSHFEKRIWVCVSDPFEEERIFVEILESLLRKKPNLAAKNNIQEKISELVSKKRILLVLDDVWTEDSSKWDSLKASLKSSSPGSRVLVTSRKKEVGLAMGSRSTTDMLMLEKLSEDKCWSLFSHLAYPERTREERKNLEHIGRKILEKCQGLPLAVKALGSLLRSKAKEHEWQSILDSKMWEIPGVENSVFPPLFLSYYDLSPVLRQCFSYCAIFPKDYKIKKDELIKLWMAQGFVKEIGNRGREIIGEDYFNTLAMHSFFQDFEKDKNDDIIGCKMHDVVHDFAQFLTKKECLFIEIDGVKESWKDLYFKNILHSMLMLKTEDATLPIPVSNWKKLRTLLIKFNHRADQTSLESLLTKVLDQLTCLRAIYFSPDHPGGSIKGLPDKIGKLIHLRCLILSGNRDLIKLPEAICDLCNLQTLDITECWGLTELPNGIGKLVNLVYLENEKMYSLRFMPKGMERLTCLRTVKEFVVSDGGDSCSLQGLGKLTLLQGDLTIRFRSYRAEASEASEARFSAMTGLRKLTLRFDGDNLRPENEAFAVEALQPPPSIESLVIESPRGPTFFPSWMMSLKMLKSVSFFTCDKWESLPPMGKLPSLESLIIVLMDKVKKVGEEFLGIETGDSSSSVIVAFPNLKTLVFWEMGEWEEWEYDYEKISRSRGGQEDSSCITIDIMPRLQSLSIFDCPKLKALPRHLLQNTPTINELEIGDCPFLEERFEEGRGEDWPYISNIPNITITKEPPVGIISEEGED